MKCPRCQVRIPAGKIACSRCETRGRRLRGETDEQYAARIKGPVARALAAASEQFLNDTHEAIMHPEENARFSGLLMAVSQPGPNPLDQPIETITELLMPKTAIDRLLKKTEPIPPTTILLNFAPDKYAAIQDEKVTPEEIQQLVLWLIAGELQHVVEAA